MASLVGETMAGFKKSPMPRSPSAGRSTATLTRHGGSARFARRRSTAGDLSASVPMARRGSAAGRRRARSSRTAKLDAYQGAAAEAQERLDSLSGVRGVGRKNKRNEAQLQATGTQRTVEQLSARIEGYAAEREPLADQLADHQTWLVDTEDDRARRDELQGHIDGLAWDAAVELEADPAEWLTQVIGQPADSDERRARWLGTAGDIVSYRTRYDIDEPHDTLGARPDLRDTTRRNGYERVGHVIRATQRDLTGLEPDHTHQLGRAIERDHGLDLVLLTAPVSHPPLSVGDGSMVDVGSRVKQFWGRLWFSVRTNYWRGLAGAFAAIGVGWSVVELTSFFMDDPAWLDDLPWLALVVGVGLVGGLAAAWRPTRVRFNLATTDTRVEIRFGDLFESSGHRVIPVNEFFDSEVGEIVSADSLHGQLIRRHFDGREADFDAAVAEALAGTDAQPVSGRAAGKTDAYEIGTTARLVVEDSGYLLVAVTTMNPTTHEAFADVTQLWKALLSMWDTARARAGGDTISVPLIGSGLARVGIPPHALLQLLVLALVVSTKQKKVARDARIVLHADLFESIDLRPIKKEWT